MKSSEIGADYSGVSSPRLRDNPWVTLVVLALGFFLTMLDLTIVNIAIPSMVADFDATLGAILWGVNAYVLVLGALLITTGRLGDRYGPRRMFLFGTALFTLFSLACGLAQSAPQLIAARALQGLGAACMLPQTMAMIVRIFPAEQRGTALGIWSSVAGLAAVAGPALGGLLVTTLGWRSIFLINIPIGVLVLAMALVAVPDLRLEQRHRLDPAGVLLVSLTLFCLIFALMEGQRFQWAGWIWATLAAAALFAIGFLLQQRSRQEREPLVPFALFRDRNYSAMNLVTMMISLGIIALVLLMSVFFQSVLGFSALDAGLAIAPASLVSMLLAPFSGRLSDRIDGRLLLVAGLGLSALGMLWVKATMQPDANWGHFVPPMVVVGIGNGLMVAPMTVLAMRGIPPELAGAASGVMNTVRQIGSALAVAAVGALVQYRLAALSPAGSSTDIAGAPPEIAGQALLPVMLLPVAAMLLGAAACAATRRVG